MGLCSPFFLGYGMDSLHKVAAAAVEAAGFEFYGLELVGAEGRPIVRVYIDQPSGILVDDCEKASRQVGAAMDVAGLFPGGYVLEVSSPGLDRPLFLPEHYQAAIGKQVAVKLKMQKEGQRHFKGRLVECAEATYHLETEKGRQILALSETQSARVVPDFPSHARGK